MAKCSICNSRKGKRLCKISETAICSLCCAETRKKETCTGCPHYRDPKPQNKYTDLPMFSLQRMEHDYDLQDYGNAIESTLCAFDQSMGNMLTDKTALGILELLLEKYHFKKQVLMPEDNLLAKGFPLVESTIKSDLPDIADETIEKLLGTIYFVAKRRSKGNREYLDFIHEYVGIRVAKGMRAVPPLKDLKP